MGAGYTANTLQPEPLLSRPAVWGEACEQLSEVRYPLKDGEAKIEVNWEQVRANAVIDSLLDVAFYEHLMPVEAVVKKLEELTPEKRRPQLNCTVSLSGVAKSEQAQQRTASHIVELFLYDLFFLMNLAAPGSCNLDGTFKSSDDDIPTSIDLDSYFLEHVWTKALALTWPSIQVIPLKEVIHWKESLRIGTQQIASTRTERAIFALLQVCKINSYDPATLLWLSHSLEALFDTPVALIGQFLQKRIMALLNVTSDKKKFVKKQCREFYDTRSAFVHGSLEIAHPLENEVLDSQVNQYRQRLAEAIDFALSVCLATLQLQVQEGWKQVSFDDVFSGVPLGSLDDKP